MYGMTEVVYPSAFSCIPEFGGDFHTLGGFSPVIDENIMHTI